MHLPPYIWPLDAEEPVLCFSCERMWLRLIPFYVSFLPFWGPVLVPTLKVNELQPRARPASLRRVEFLSTPADPKRGRRERAMLPNGVLRSTGWLQRRLEDSAWNTDK